MTVVRAPGRVNLIGEHTDYSDGFCLPVAIDRECRITASPLDAPVVRAGSAQMAGTVEIALAGGPPYRGPRWGRFVDGAVQVVREAGHPVAGCSLAVDSSVPAGSGLSSSSALAVALVLTLLPVDAPERADPRALARLALAAEVLATGVPGGLLDQMASLCGRADHALLLDCRDLSVEPIPLPPDLAILVVHSGVARDLADSEYGARRRACEAAASRLGVACAPGRDPRAGRVRSDRPPRRLGEPAGARLLRRAAAPATSSVWARSSGPAMRACATTSVSRPRSWTCSSTFSSSTVRSGPA